MYESMSADDTRVTHEVLAHVIVDDQPPTPIPSELRYDPSDPHAVCLSVGAPARDAVDWVFARALLAEGTCRPVGLGDVLVSPRQHWVRVTVRSRAGSATLDMAACTVAGFLRHTNRLVPPGTEERYVDLEGVIAQLVADHD
jgi:hypothetical protein